jgi:very-short-patch-repair endonuclease
MLPPYSVVWELSAAWLYGADVCREDDLNVRVAYPPGRPRRPQAGLTVSQATFSPGDVETISGIRLTSPTRTAFDCLRMLPHPEGIVAADALTHLRRCTSEQIVEYARAHRPVRNLRVAQRLAPWVEPATESPMESRLRMALIDGGLPRPVAQFELHAGTQFVARLDLAYPGQRVAVEYDGAWHWRQRREDDLRRDRVRAIGWIVLVVGAAELYADPAAVCARVRAALAQSEGRRV